MARWSRLWHPCETVALAVVVDAGRQRVAGNGDGNLGVVAVHGDDHVSDDGVVIAVDVDAAAMSPELYAVLLAIDQHGPPAVCAHGSRIAGGLHCRAAPGQARGQACHCTRRLSRCSQACS
jgi:hypothetical protein